jgi:exodeoxyribonuclease VII large subunit
MQGEGKIYKITELVQNINNFFETNYSNIYVEGEISELRPARSGHIYLTLKDDRGSILRGVIFKWASQRIRNIEDLKIGNCVIAEGNLNIYSGSSNFQMIIVNIFSMDEKGKWQQEFEKLKKVLGSKGYFDPERKRKLPKVVKNVGVITSSTGAAIKDLVSVLKRRMSDVKIVLYPATVQGKKAPKEIIRGIDFFNTIYKDDLDAIIIGRGGGSMEDLWCFNDGKLADTIFGSRLPIVSAVGHERDFTISDLVADVRAATPTAAAELISIDQSDMFFRTRESLLRTYTIINNRFNLIELRFGKIREYIFRYENRINTLSQRFDTAVIQIGDATLKKFDKIRNIYSELKNRLYSNFSMEKVELLQEKLSSFTVNLLRSMKNRFKITQNIIIQMGNRLSGLSPFSILERGYSIIYKDDSIVKKYMDVEKGDKLRAILHNGELDLEVLNGRERKKI